MKCTGHTQAQNTLPSTMHTSSTTTTLITAIGMAVRSAIMASSAPRGAQQRDGLEADAAEVAVPPAVKCPTYRPAAPA